MIAFWESSWSNFLVLDADTIVWGDVLKLGNFKKSDLIVDQPCQENSDADISKLFFDIPGVEKHFLSFSWSKYRANYFCTGTFLLSAAF
ncbi:hypothetical protein [Microcoleus sp. B4-D4]|uniref:hypothetical protein n=1 Tax=Microcoleus sp. B4-D4 TaxID=2818667 RepID=UPI002FD63D0B